MDLKHCRKESSNEPPSVGYVAFLITVACLMAIVHRNYLSSMFENDRHFSHLSTLERELTLRTEMGLYYSYYKTLVQAPSLWHGVHSIIHDNTTEYPECINAFQRFNIFPEVIAAVNYRLVMKAMSILGLPTKQCWQVKRVRGLSSVVSCEGIGEPIYFYIECAFFMNGVMVAFLFLFAVYLGGSVLSGGLTVLCFFYNHTECTRVQWTPALRESFAYPFFVVQMFILTFILRSERVGLLNVICLSVSTLCFMLPWQFAQFALLTQMMSIFSLYLLRYICSYKIKVIAIGLLIATFTQSALMFGNRMVVASYFVASCFAVLVVASLEIQFWQVQVRFVFEAVLMLIFTFLIKIFLSWILQVTDDSHIFHLLLSKFTNFQTFDTMLYSCAAEFDFLPFETIVAVTKTLVLPMAIVSVVIILFQVFRNRKINDDRSGSESQLDCDIFPVGVCASLLYHVIQLAAFSIMALLVMRLKLFWTPHLCLISSVIGSPIVAKCLGTCTRHQVLLSIIVAVMSVQGVKNIYEEHSILGEFSGIHMEQLVGWISENTNETAVFAGSMPTMATVKLCTSRPIVNHPHYEDAGLRARTKKVYSLFSRKSEEEIWRNLMDLRVDYVINEHDWCSGKSRNGCGLAEIWDLEDTENAFRTPACQRIHVNPEPFFQRAFKNHLFDVLRIVKMPNVT